MFSAILANDQSNNIYSIPGAANKDYFGIVIARLSNLLLVSYFCDGNSPPVQSTFSELTATFTHPNTI